MKLVILEVLQNAKKDGWSNFGKGDLTEREVGFNEGIVTAIEYIKAYVLKVELVSTIMLDEMYATTLDLQAIGKRKIAEQLAEHIIDMDLARVEVQDDPIRGAKELRGTLFLL
jgi:hypothetical protein